MTSDDAGGGNGFRNESGDDELMNALSAMFEADAEPSRKSIEPPAQMLLQLRQAVANRGGERREADVPEEEPEPRRIMPPFGWLAVAAAALVILIGGSVVTSALLRSHPSAGGEVEFAGPITSDQGAVGELKVVKIGIGRVVSLKTTQLPILPATEYYEIWFVAPDDTPGSPNRISAGTFHPDSNGRSEVTFAAAVDPVRFPLVEITAEPGDGNPTQTGPVVMKAQIATDP